MLNKEVHYFDWKYFDGFWLCGDFKVYVCLQCALAAIIIVNLKGMFARSVILSDFKVYVCLQCVLAAVIIVNLKGMFVQIGDLKKLWYISKYDFVSIADLKKFLYVCKYNFVS